MKLIKKLIFSYLLLSGMTAFSQDPTCSQFYSNPVSLNPAFAGSAACSRACIDYRLQWPNIPGDFKTLSVSYDQYSNTLKGGIGFNYIYDALGIENNNYANVFYSYNIKLSENLLIKPAVNIGFVKRIVDWSEFFPQQHNTIMRRSYFNAGAGALFIYKNLIGGFAVDHLNNPNVGFFSSSLLPIKFTAHLSYQFNIKDKFSITPLMIFQKEQNFVQYIPNLLFNISYIKFGVGLRTGLDNPDSFISMIGFQNKWLSIGYSYDYTISRLTNASGGSHEISAVMKFNCKNKTGKFYIPQMNGF